MSARDSEPSSLSRRTLLAAGAAAGGVLSLGLGACGDRQPVTGDSNADGDLIPLTFAGYPYDRVRALQDGSVEVGGCAVSFQPDGIGTMNTHVFSGPQTREVSEVGLAPFVLAWCNGGFRDYDLLPIFPLRIFRHKSIFIHTDRGIESPADLKGRRVATVGYSSSSLTWIRGILQDEYGVSPQDVTWVFAGKDSSADLSGGPSAWEKQRPDDLKIEVGPVGKDESDLLVDGDVDAIFHPAEPRAFIESHPKVGQLFPDHRSVERAYYEKTGIFPIMHMVAIRRDTTERHPGLPKAVFEAYVRAKQADYRRMRKMGAYFSSLPWYGQELRDTRALMGENFYAYGVEDNRNALETAFRYLHEQGLASRLVKPEEIFHPSTLTLRDV